MTTTELQAEIRKLIQGMGWSIAEAARCVYFETIEVENDVEQNRYVECFKKRLSRPSTPLAYLEGILGILTRQKQARLMAVKPTYVPGSFLDPSLQRQLQAISKDIDREIEDETLLDDERR